MTSSCHVSEIHVDKLTSQKLVNICSTDLTYLPLHFQILMSFQQQYGLSWVFLKNNHENYLKAMVQITLQLNSILSVSYAS